MATVKNHTENVNAKFTADMVRTYLREIGRVPLLSREQEIIYGKQVQQMMALLEAKEALRKEIDHEPSLSEWAARVNQSETELNHLMTQGKRAKQKMIEANLRLVVAIAKKYQKRNMEFLDLIQEGTLGLERGVEKFDPMRGYKFSTYAYWWIRQAITRAIAQQGRTIRLPIHITEKLNKIKKVQRELAQMRVGENQDTELQEMLEDDGPSPEYYTTQEFLRHDLNNLLAELTPQQRQVVALRFGLEDGNEMSLAKVGERLNLSRERVRQLEHQALAHLRRRRGNVKEYIAS